MLATYVPRMRNSNHLIQIRITVTSGRPQIVALDFVVVPIPYQTSTLQCQKFKILLLLGVAERECILFNF